MHRKIFAGLFALGVLLAEPHGATAQEEQASPCEVAAVAIAEEANKILGGAAYTSFERVQNLGKACGILSRGSQKMSEMGCPSSIADHVSSAYSSAKSTLDGANSSNGYSVSCFATDIDWGGVLWKIR